MAVVTVPEAPMREQNRVIARKYQVWLARQSFGMEPVAEAFGKKAAPQQHFRIRVGAPDASHHPAAHVGGDDVSHLRPQAGGRDV